MGEENGLKLSNGVIFFGDSTDGVKFTDIKEYDGLNSETDNSIDIQKFNDFEVSCDIRLDRKAMKILSGFGACKGPARYKSLRKYLKLHRRNQIIIRKILESVFNHKCYPFGDISIDITDLPCTDFYEWVWLTWRTESYEEYRRAKLKRINRGRNRASRHRNTLC